MDEKELEQKDFDLEDILKEFGGQEASEDYSELEFDEISEMDQSDAPQTEELPIQMESPEVPVKEKPEPLSEPMEDTIRLDVITHERKTVAADQTTRFEPVGEPEYEQPPVMWTSPEKAEPYSEKWEPEYEQPIGEYVPPEPIVFRPRSRLQELKRKLVAGPEKRYYELAEQGLGKLQLAILLNFLVAVITAASTVMYALGNVSTGHLKLMVFWQFLSILLSALLGSYQLLEGASDLLKGRFSLNSLLLFSLIACVTDGVICLQHQRIPCCAAFSLHMTMSLWGAYQKRNTEMGQMDTMRKAVRLDNVVAVEDYYEGRTGFLRGEGQVEDFMDHYRAPSEPEKVLSVYAVVALFVSVGIAVTATVLHSITLGLQSFSAAMLIATPASAFITLSRPAAILQRRLHKHGTVLCGWQGVKGLSAPGVFPLKDGDLFPEGTMKMNGVKFYGQRNPDDVVALTAALIAADGDGTAPLFGQLLDSRNGYHYEATNLHYYAGGIGGEVNGEAVLMGTLNFMQDMGVEMPQGTKVNQAVYAAIDGELCGVFAITYQKNKAASAGVSTLCAYRRLTPVLTTGDFMLTESFLRGRFGINTRKMAFPENRVRKELAAAQIPEGATSLALITGEGLASYAYAVTGARALRLASITGVVVHMIGGILGLLMLLALAIVGADHLLTPANLLLYELIWLVPGLLITEWTRAI